MSVHLDLDQLRSFVAIAESGSFTRAAGMVARTQSAVSVQMRRLEERLGHKLFEKDGRASRLTADGERLLPRARRLLQMNDETISAFDEAAMEGTVRLGVPDDYAALLPAILEPFSRARPMAEVNVVCAPTPELVKHVMAHEIDIAIITHVPSEGRANPVIVRREPLCWVTSRHHPTHRETPLPLALGSPQCDWRRAAVEQLTHLRRDYRVAFSSWNAGAVSAAVTAGLAVSVLPLSAVTADMRVLREADGFPLLPVCEIAVFRLPDKDSPLADALAEHVVQGLSAHGEARAA